MSFNSHALLTTSQMALADQAAIRAGTPGVVLMENAGRAVAHAIMRRWAPRRVLVLCGPGNNGGDGFVVARHLHAAGWGVTLATYGDFGRYGADAQHHVALWSGQSVPFDANLVNNTDLVVDAIFGAGLARPPEGLAAEVIAAVNAAAVPVCAIDVPSGVDGSTGACFESSIHANLTVTFFRKKPGHLLMPGKSKCGELVVADIGIVPAVLQSIRVDCYENHPALWVNTFPWPATTDHKYNRGHVLLYGGHQLTGAARLAARAAQRAGAGLVTVAAPAQVWPVYAASLTSIMVASYETMQQAESLLADSRKNAIVVGPGGGLTPETRQLALLALATGRNTVLDADAISVFQHSPKQLFDAIRGPCVLTPHDGEFARVFKAEGDKLQRARRAAALSGAVVLLKGADTIIAAPDGRAIISALGPPTLATGGTGDVLAGLIAGLMAQGMQPFEAAAAGAWLQAQAARHVGYGLIADDLLHALPAALQRLREA